MVFAVTGANIISAAEAAGRSVFILTAAAGFMLQWPDGHQVEGIIENQNMLALSQPSLTSVSTVQGHVLTKSHLGLRFNRKELHLCSNAS